MSKFDITTVNDVVEVEGIIPFDQHIEKGYKLLSVRTHATADNKGNISSCTLFTMGKLNPKK